MEETKKKRVIISFVSKGSTRSTTIHVKSESDAKELVSDISKKLKGNWSKLTFSGKFNVLQPNLMKTRVVVEVMAEEGNRVSKSFTLYEVSPDTAKLDAERALADVISD